MTTERPILTLPKKSDELRVKAMCDKWLVLQEKLTDNASFVASQAVEVKAFVEAIQILDELLKK